MPHLREVTVSPLTPAHEQALATLLDVFKSQGLWYRATGGLAGNLHGSAWPLHDIDLDYRREDWPRIAVGLGALLVSPPTLYADEEFRLVMAVARIAGVQVELCQLEGCQVAGPDGWVTLGTDLDCRERRSWRGRDVWTLPLAELIAYKRLLGREADLRDLRRLDAAADQATP
ncbi:MAG: hypothetical protein AB7I01_14695 [Gammaproteobacteria bacterium]